MTANRVIGCKGKIPWHLPADLLNFRELTYCNTVIMGLFTYESLPRNGLPNRLNIVLTSNTSKYSDRVHDNLIFVSSVDQSLEVAKSANREIFIIGGGHVYEQFFPLADYAYLSLVKGCCEGDAFFPDVDWYDWKKVKDVDCGDYVYRVMKRNFGTNHSDINSNPDSAFTSVTKNPSKSICGRK